MSTAKPIQIRSKPGIQRDGTRYDAEAYVDAQWTRFDRNMPRKMGGFRSVTSSLPEAVYGLHGFGQNNLQYVHLGSASFLEQAILNPYSGGLSALNDRTPVALVVSAQNLWQIDALPNAVARTSNVIAHAAPNLADIASNVETAIWYDDDITDTPALTDTGLDPVSGGIVVSSPYLFSFGSAGYISYTAPNDPTTPDFTARVAAQKVVAGANLRGGGFGPSALFWSLDSLIRATFQVSGANDFAFDTIGSTTIMSSRSVVEYDGIYYWWGIDRPQMFNGVIQEVPNAYNIDWFLDNFDFSRRQEVFGFAMPRWGEIWWVFPIGLVWYAVIYNVRQRIWYDTRMPDAGRSSGMSPSVFPKPLLTDLDLTADGYSLWQHEIGMDKVRNTNVEPVPAYFETSDFSMATAEEPDNTALRVAQVEPDFVQTGDMTLEITGNINARAPTVTDGPYTFVDDPGSDPAKQVVFVKTQRRQLRFKFSSNTPGGNFFMGHVLAQLEPADGRTQS